MGSAERSEAAGESELLDVARAAVALALSEGRPRGAGGAYRVRSVEVQWRDGKLEKISEATTRGLGLELYVEGRYSSVSTSDLRPEAVERFVEDAVALTRKLSVDRTATCRIRSCTRAGPRWTSTSRTRATARWTRHGGSS